MTPGRYSETSKWLGKPENLLFCTHVTVLNRYCTKSVRVAEELSSFLQFRCKNPLYWIYQVGSIKCTCLNDIRVLDKYGGHINIMISIGCWIDLQLGYSGTL